jgi:hypothetical protein
MLERRGMYPIRRARASDTELHQKIIDILDGEVREMREKKRLHLPHLPFRQTRNV